MLLFQRVLSAADLLNQTVFLARGGKPNRDVFVGVSDFGGEFLDAPARLTGALEFGHNAAAQFTARAAFACAFASAAAALRGLALAAAGAGALAAAGAAPFKR